MVEIVEVEKGEDFLPLDQIDEGVFIRELRYRGGVFVEWSVGRVCYTVEMVDGQEWKLPQWTYLEWPEPTFPMTVMRGLDPPRCPDG